MSDVPPDPSEPSEQRDASRRRPWRTDVEWDRLRGRIDAAAGDSPVRRPWRRYAGGLAAAAVLIAAGLVVPRILMRPAGDWHVVTTAAGGRVAVQLDDSSTVILGPTTTLRYRVSARWREAELNGLADFKVAHDTRRPFQVRAGNATATDIGTEFGVRAYVSDSAVRVSVTSGAVRLAGSASMPSVTLAAGQAGHVAPSGVARTDANIDVAASDAWVSGRLVFQNEPLADVAAELSRWFDVDIRVPDTALAVRRVTAMYATPTLAGVLEALGTSLGARYEQRGRSVTFRPNRPATP